MKFDYHSSSNSPHASKCLCAPCNFEFEFHNHHFKFMGIINIIFIIIYYEDYGINYHSLPLRGSLSPQPIYNPTPQHKYQHTYKLAYHNSIASFSISNLFQYRNCHAQTALHELVDDHVFLTSARCKWHSNPNFWGEMEWRRFVWCASRLVGANLLKFLEGFVFVSGMNALDVKLVKAHWHTCSIETMPT